MKRIIIILILTILIISCAKQIQKPVEEKII